MKKAILITLVLALTVFLVYNFVNFSYSDNSYTVAELETMEKKYDFEGIISRDEYPLTIENTNGIIFEPAVSENEMVKKGKLVATCYDASIDDATRRELSDINSRISEIKAMPVSSDDKLSTDIDEINHEMDDRITSMVSAATSRSMSEVTSLKKDIDELLTRKKDAGQGNDASKTIDETLSELESEKSKLEHSFGGKKTDLNAPSHGIFSTGVDGYEKILTSEKALSMDVSDYESIVSKSISSKDLKKENVVCKIMDNSQWWISVLSDSETAKNFAVGDSIQIRFTGSPDEATAKIEYISSPVKNKCIITAVSNDYSDYSMKYRIVKATFVKASYTGLKIPVSAIRVKDGKTGVYVKGENAIKYKEIKVIYKDDKNAIAELDNTKSNALLLYDEIITS